MNSNSVLFVGCGDLGIRSGLLLLDKGWQVAGMRRDPSQLPAGFARFGGDYTESGDLDFIDDLRPAHVVASFNPSGRSLEGYQRGFTQAARNLREALDGWRPQTLIMVSSTRVFAESEGGWVDEASPLAADDPRALAIIAAEQLLQNTADNAALLRCAGIYGATPGRLLEKVRRGEISPPDPVRYSNRIHRDDCAGLLVHLLQLSASGTRLAPIYIGVDDLPVPQAEVEAWLASQMGVQGGVVPAAGSAAEQRFAVGHKRCRNRELHASGYRLRYPDYRAGYGAMLVGDA